MALTPDPQEFKKSRHRGNFQLAEFSTVAKKISEMDQKAYSAGSLEVFTKELMGLSISFAKDCEECAFYHLEQLAELQITQEQLSEAIDLILVGCGSVAFPLARKSLEFFDQLKG